MAVLFDAATEIAAGSTASPTTGTHTPVGTPKGVEVLITYPTGTGGSADIISGVTYGGVAMDRVGIAQDITQESGTVVQYFLGTGIPTGAQTVSVQRTEATTAIHVTSRTLTAGGDMERISTASIHESQADPSVDIAVDSRSSIVLGGIWSGLNSPASLVEQAGLTRDTDHDYGASSSIASRQTTAGTSDSTFGYTSVITGTAMLASAFGELATDTTRFYMLGDLFGEDDDEAFGPGISPDVSVNWDDSFSQFTRGSALTSKAGLSQQFAVSDNIDADLTDVAYAQFISEPLAAQTISGDLNVVGRAYEADPDVNATLAYVLRVVKPDGTERGELASSFAAGLEAAVDSTYQTRAYASVAVTPLAVEAGDRLVFEIGYHQEATVDEIGALLFKTDELTADSPLLDNDVSDSNTWFEIEQDLTFAPTGSAWAHGEPVATLSATAAGTAVTTTPSTASGSPVATLSATATGSVFTQPHMTGSGSPVATLSATAAGGVTMTPITPITASGAPRRRLSARATGTVLNPDGGEPPPRPKAKGGAVRFITYKDPEEPKKKRKRRRKRPDAPEVAELPGKDLNLAGVDLSGIDTELVKRLRSRMALPAGPDPAPETEPEPAKEPTTKTVEDRLLEHFLSTLDASDVPQMDEDDMPFALQRFLQMGKKDKR